MLDKPILSLLTFLPLLGAVLIMTLRGDQKIVAQNAKYTALWTTVLVFGLSLFMLSNFNQASPDMQFVEKSVWFPALGLTYHMGVDGISVLFVVLTAFLMPICVLASWNSVQKRVPEYMVAFLLLQTFMIGTFCALDAVLFYVFFEATLIPMFLIIGIWGGERRVYASFKFFLYTLLGSVLMLVALIVIANITGTTDMTAWAQASIPANIQTFLWLAFFASFAVKMPMWPVHTWLPDAHVEAPTAGSVILAGILLKMGGYGFLRFSLPVLPEASLYFAPFVFALSVIAVLYTSLVALVQSDMKKLIAYSSVAHMGFVTLGIFTFNQQGIDGAIFQMLSHGVISAALFLCVGVVYDRLHSRDISRYGGIVNNMPNYAVVFMILTLGSVGLPGTSGFVGEFLVLLGAYQVTTFYTALAATGVILGAAYMLLLYKKVVFGAPIHTDSSSMPDLNAREIFYFIPLVFLVIALGIFPTLITKYTGASVQKLTEQVARVKIDPTRGLVPTPPPTQVTP